MAIFGIYSYHLTEPTNEFYTSIGSCYVIFWNIVFLSISSAIFCYQNVIHLDLVLRNVSLVVGGIQAAGMFISVGINMKTVKKFHLKLQQLVDEGIKNFLKQFIKHVLI